MAVTAVAMEDMEVTGTERGLLRPKLSQDTFPEDMEDMVVMAVAMGDMEVMVMERGLLRPRLSLLLKLLLKPMLSQDIFPEDMAAMEAMEIMVNCYNCFSFPPLTSSINWPQDTKAE